MIAVIVHACVFVPPSIVAKCQTSECRHLLSVFNLAADDGYILYRGYHPRDTLS
jgi:hypothetical protein